MPVHNESGHAQGILDQSQMAVNWDKIMGQFEDQCLKLWPQACVELRGLIAHFDQTGATITAEQLRMALELAGQRYDQIVAKRN